MKSNKVEIEYELFQHADELPEDEAQLLADALTASKKAHAPFSKFHVGCALQLEGGEIILGNNQENVAFPSGLCAERTALFYTGSEGKAHLVRKMGIRAVSENMVISKPPTSCGACRQVMVEYEKMAGQDFVVLMQGETGSILRLKGVQNSLMPFTFNLDF